MKFSIYALVALLVLGVASLSPLFAEVNEQEVATADCKLKAYTDPAVMAQTMANPAKFMEFVAIFNDPQVPFNAMNTCLDQEQFNQIMANMSNPTSMMNASAQFMNPQMYMNWMTAMMNPAFYTTAMNTYGNPQLYMNFMTAFMNPAYYMQYADPKLATNASAWMMNPNSFTGMFTAFQAPVVAAATPAQ